MKDIPAPQLIRLTSFAHSYGKENHSERVITSRRKMSYYVYFLKDNEGHLYIGQTNNLRERINQQKSKSTKSSKFVKDGKEFDIVYFETYATRLESMRREKQLKGWTRAKKEALIAGDLELLKKTLVKDIPAPQHTNLLL